VFTYIPLHLDVIVALLIGFGIGRVSGAVKRWRKSTKDTD
jgi:hypothetical protein